MSEFFRECDIARSIDIGVAGAQVLVNLNAIIPEAHACRFKAQPIDLRLAAGTEEQRVVRQFARAGWSAHCQSAATRVKGPEAEMQPKSLALEPAADQFPGLWLIIGKQVGHGAYQIHLAAQSKKRLCQLARQWTAADNNQSGRQLGKGEDALISQVFARSQAFDRGYQGVRSGSDHRLV